MSSTTTEVKYSQGSKDIGAAKSFSWEYPVPKNAFWGPLDFVVGRNFLKCFSSSELQAMELRLIGSLPNFEKYELLLKILNEKLEASNKAATPRTMQEVDHKAWDDLMLGIVTMYARLNRLSDQESTVRLLIAKRQDPSNLSHFYNLAGVLLEQGKYAEAEERASKARDWLDGKLGKDSPQALGARKIIAEAAWKQGRVEEAMGLMGEMEGIVDGGGEGTFGIYMDEQREMLSKMKEELEAWKEGE